MASTRSAFLLLSMRQRRKSSKRSDQRGRPDAVVTQKRGARRLFVRLPGRVTVSSTSKRVNEQVTLVRDISSHGLFFFADFDLQKGEQISLILEYLRSSEHIRLQLSGTVVRVEKPTKHATTGIAVCFDSPLKEIPGLH